MCLLIDSPFTLLINLIFKAHLSMISLKLGWFWTDLCLGLDVTTYNKSMFTHKTQLYPASGLWLKWCWIHGVIYTDSPFIYLHLYRNGYHSDLIFKSVQSKIGQLFFHQWKTWHDQTFNILTNSNLSATICPLLQTCGPHIHVLLFCIIQT